MGLHVTVLAADAARESFWAAALRSILGPVEGLTIGLASEGGPTGQVLFVDAAMPDLESRLEREERAGRAFFALLPEGAPHLLVQRLVEAGRIDDALIYPFRELEARAKLRQYHQLALWEEVSRLSSSFAGIVQRLREDLSLAERLQKRNSPLRFPEVKGFTVKSRYLAGMKSGGDHFDLAESSTGNQLSIVLADSSSYGLSSALLSALMRVAVKLSADDVRSCEATVRRIHEELALTLSQKDRLSLFYGTVSRADYRLRYVNLGTSCAFCAGPGGEFVALASQGAPLASGEGLPSGTFQAEIGLEPGGRLALLSDGFLEVLGGGDAVIRALNRFRGSEAIDFLNEIVFQLKSGLSGADDLPAQDCTAVLLDVDTRILRKL